MRNTESAIYLYLYLLLYVKSVYVKQIILIFGVKYYYYSIWNEKYMRYNFVFIITLVSITMLNNQDNLKFSMVIVTRNYIKYAIVNVIVNLFSLIRFV